MENKLTALKVGEIAPTKQGLEVMADGIAEQVNEGNINPLDVAIRMNAMEQLCKIVKEKIQGSVMDELFKHPKQKADVYGASISEMTSVKYDYSHIHDWSVLEGIIQNAKEKQKEIEEEEKKWRRGELPVKSATSTFKVQLSK